MEKDSSTNSYTYMEDDDYQPLTSSPWLTSLLNVRGIAEAQAEIQANTDTVMGAAAAVAVTASAFLER